LERELGLEADIGLRYLTRPAYSTEVADYEVLNLPVALAIRYRITR
jgi:hypothetical protein